MRRALLIAAIATLAATGIASAAPSSGRVAVVRCPTSFPFSTHPTPPASLSVLHSPSSTQGLVAYTNYEEFLVAPAGMQCAGGVGADGNGGITVWPKGLTQPKQHAKIEGLTLTVIPTCLSCKAEVACPFFHQFASEAELPCSGGIPKGEIVERLSAQVTLFEDPAGVAGSGFPSGGPYRANGVVGVGSRPEQQVYSSTCTLPASQRWICTVSLNDVLSRYGH